ncbi:MAG: flagellar protein FlaG [Desulfurivibrionaceae bacterium]|nr:flagellar protein FlaG [Desulfurivibrionaceae bacterium]
MDVNISTDMKGVSQPAVSAVEVEDRSRPPVAPVAKSGDSAQGNLDDQALHGRKPQQPSSSAELAEMAEEIEGRFDTMGAKLGFSIRDESEDIVMEVRERESGDLIRQIPSEEVLALREKLNELVGLLFDKQV